MDAPESGLIRCPKECPERRPGCHNEETCKLWAAQTQQRKQERQARWDLRCIYPQSWAQRGIIKYKKGRKGD